MSAPPAIRRLLAIAVLAALIGAGALAMSAQATLPCLLRSCRATLAVGDKPVQWTSTQRFAADAPLRLDIRVHGRSLTQEYVTSCKARYYGAGVVVQVVVCGRRAPIKVRAVSVGSHRTRVSVSYRLLHA